MSTTLEELLAQYVYTQLQDSENKVRWTRDELTQYVNFALRDLVARRPEAGALTDRAMVLREGMRQLLPDGAIRLKEVVRNVDHIAGVVGAQQPFQQLVDILAQRAIAAEVGAEQVFDQLVDIVSDVVGELLFDVDAIQVNPQADITASVAFDSGAAFYSAFGTASGLDVVAHAKDLTLGTAVSTALVASQPVWATATSDGTLVYVGRVSGDATAKLFTYNPDTTVVTDISATLGWADDDWSPSDGKFHAATGVLAIARANDAAAAAFPAIQATVLSSPAHAVVCTAGGFLGTVRNRGAGATTPSYDYNPLVEFSPGGDYVFLVGHGARRFDYDSTTSTYTYLSAGANIGNVQCFDASTGAVVTTAVTQAAGHEIDLFWLGRVPNTDYYFGIGLKFNTTTQLWEDTLIVTRFTYTGGLLVQASWSARLEYPALPGLGEPPRLDMNTAALRPGEYTRRRTAMSPDGKRVLVASWDSGYFGRSHALINCADPLNPVVTLADGLPDAVGSTTIRGCGFSATSDFLWTYTVPGSRTFTVYSVSPGASSSVTDFISEDVQTYAGLDYGHAATYAPAGNITV